MKLTKQLEAEVLQVYDTWLYSYLNGDVKTYDLYLDDEYHFIGSTDNEEFLNRKETTKFFKATAEQLAGKTDLKNKTRTIELFDSLVFITEVFDAWFLAGTDWNYYGRFRFTSALRKKKERWLFIYQHFSMPDAKAQEGETIGFEQVSAENIQLREAIKRRTIELENKNRELEIETALERVRAIALSMKEPGDMPEVCRIIAVEMDKLGVKEIRNVQTAIFYEGRGTYMNYEYYLKHDKKIITETSYTNHQTHQAFADQMLKGKGEFFSTLIDAGALRDWIAYQKTTNVYIDTYLEEASSLNYYWDSLGHVALGISTYLPLSEKDIELFRRFRNVFELAYRRYLDIEKAEAQAREAQIEVALEKVRSKTVGMHKSEDLYIVINEVSRQLKQLGFVFDGANFITDYSGGSYKMWLAAGENSYPFQIHIPYVDHKITHEMENAFSLGQEFFAYTLTKEEKNNYFKHFFENTVAKNNPEETKQWIYSTKGMASSCVVLKSSILSVINFDSIPYTSQENEIIQRFAKVFEQTYTRFLDLQKAEAQAREAKIEMALEKIRSRTMAMQHSDELPEAANLLFLEVQALGIPAWSCGYNVLAEDKKTSDCWMSSEGAIQEPFTLYFTEEASFIEWHQFLLSEENFYVQELGGKNLEDHYNYMRNIPKLGEVLKKLEDAGISLPTYQINHLCKFTFGFLLFITYEPVPDAHDIFKRFGKVFDQTYTRFLDLQKAEAQTREAKIEAALERVRSKAMAMHSSEDLAATIGVFYREMESLSFTPRRCGVGLIEKQTHVAEISTMNTTEDGESIEVIGKLPLVGHPILEGIYNSWLLQKEYHPVLRGNEIKDYYQLVRPQTGFPDYPNDAVQYGYFFFFDEGGVYAWTDKELSEDELQIYRRFTSVLSLTYKRYKDLKQAEAQAREAKIEAALERARAQTMAMNKSQDLQQVVSVIFRELDKLELKTLRCGIGIMNADNRSVDVWTTTTTNEGYEVNFSGNESMDVHPMLQGVFAAWEKQEDFYYVLQREELISYYNTMTGDNYKLPDVAAGASVSDRDCQYYYCTFFVSGGLYFFREIPFTEGIIKVIRRFANAFSLAYKRFEDLKKSEARALEAIKESSLDRVRAEIASMRTTDDLQRITPIIWRELTMLEVPFFRCGVFIIDETNTEVKIYLSAPDGHSLGVMNVPFNTNSVTINSVDHWRKGLVYTEHWDKETFVNWMQTMIEQGQIQSSEAYQDTAKPPESLDLHFVPFSQGMLYVGNSNPLPKEKIDLVKSLAEAFSIAYARYEDFNKLESAKEQIEKTLVDLKQAQAQLVQSEKMASLGELTAGIAHEIQNPLNFVNNFSEVSTELLDEMIAELGNDNKADAIAIADHVKQNLEKILHHGKQADGIVKGMLQHSRSRSAKKELTDINKLADEYLRLAFHGLRAKDKSFNAILKTDYDETIGNINIIPQDIGRVILNLITNAFYAVGEKKKRLHSLKGGEEYEPVVTVTTKRLNSPPAGGDGGKIEISVRDNGNGIPQKVLDKIFQPFFTTKPTGQGTGLGLSLAYDIVKAHSGDLRVETKEVEGSSFIISLPA